jgi:hypothetical protein
MMIANKGPQALFLFPEIPYLPGVKLAEDVSTHEKYG